MKRYYLLLIAVLLTIVGRASADNIEVANTEMLPGETKEMAVSLNNTSKMYTAFQFDMVLPEGVTIAKNANDKLMVSLDKDRMNTDNPHSLTVQEVHQSEGATTKTYRFVAYSAYNYEFLGNSGALLHVTLQSAEDITAGNKTATIKNQVFTEVSGNQEKWDALTFTVTIVFPVIKADDKSRLYGDENPTLTYTSSANLNGEPELTTTATKTSTVGNYDIVVGKGTLTGGYTAINGQLTITKAPLTITAKNFTITQGDVLPTYEVEYSGFKNDETSAVLTKQPTVTATVTSSSEPGTFDIVASGAEADNYEITYVKGTLTITPGVYKLIYMVDGEVYKTYDVVYGTTITPEPTPTKEGYTFSGWSEIPKTMPAHDVTVTGTFTVNKYKLTYMVDGEEYKSYDIEYGATITAEAEPTKEGYTFSGWSEIPKTMPAHDVTVTGSFSINRYKLTYIVDGEVYKTYDVEYGVAITPEAEPSKEGYTFSGWSEIPATMPAHDVTITGTFAVNSYKLTYIVDGEVYKSYDIEYGAAITPEAEPAKEGYTFSGWSEIPKTMPAHDVTVTGSFSKGQYKLIYMVDGQTYKTISYDYGEVITPEPAPVREGYTFSGWSEIPETMPAHDVTVTGAFAVNSYKLTYIVDGEVYKTYDVEYGNAITPEPAPVREGYTFSGWSEIPKTMPAYDVTVTGTFSVNKYKLTYMVDGEEYKSYDIEYGATITAEAEPTKEGYTFSGWSEIPKTMPAHDVTITGSFKVNKYKVNYYVDNNPYYTDMVEYGATITPPSVPEREGYDFAWSYIPDTMPAYDISVYGQYTIKTGIMTISVEHPVDVYDLQGNKVRSRATTLKGLAKGVYIVNGRKMVVK